MNTSFIILDPAITDSVINYSNYDSLKIEAKGILNNDRAGTLI